MPHAEERTPALFGQKHSSRDYSKSASWGKNQFNSSFPASLLAYMAYKGVNPVYLKVDEGNHIVHADIAPSDVLGIDPLSDDAYYNFEAGYSPYEIFYEGDREKIDLVMLNRRTGALCSGLEVKLTALPDNTTKNKSEEEYGCEIVVRPPTICFLVCSLCHHFRDNREGLKRLLDGVPQIRHWEEADEVSRIYQQIEAAVMRVSSHLAAYQTPLIVQPIWKTQGAKMRLADDCLDIFVWSDLAVLQMCVNDEARRAAGVNRFQRTIVWVYKMLFDFVAYGQFDYQRIVRDHSYGNANDKAFALPGSRSHVYMACPELTHPRISKQEIRHIILNGGQEYLSPERRFDAVIVNSPDLF